MYDVKEMKARIDNASSVAKLEVREIFKNELQKIYSDNEIPDSFSKDLKISISKLSKPVDIKNILSGAGFYIIVTDLKIPDNKCKLTFRKELKAIYRGECGTVKRRIQSHLFNDSYKADYEQRKSDYMANPDYAGKDFYEQYWPACLKIGNGTDGLNIDKDYGNNEWYVLVHNMIGSSREVRVQAELAFDDAFNKPAASRENT